MKIIVALLTVFYLQGPVLGQVNGPVRESEIRATSKGGGNRPKITLQEALKLAEEYTRKERIDVSDFFLLEAKFILFGSKGDGEAGGGAQQPAWSFYWMNENHGPGSGISIVVIIKTREVKGMPTM